MEQQLKPNKDDNEKEHVIKMFRSPTLETVKMVEKSIEKYSGEFKKTQLWEKLPRKIMWPTYLIILKYLEDINKIITSDNGVITYIWDSKAGHRYLSRKSY